jgi:hypothetical protein
MGKRSKSPTAAKRSSLDTAELDRAWDDVAVEMTSSAYRESLPTPYDADPLRFDVVQSEHAGKHRDKLATLPEADPLRFDVVP